MRMKNKFSRMCINIENSKGISFMHNGMTYVLQIGMTSNIGGMETYLIEQYKNINKKQINYDFLTLFDDEKIAFCEYIHSNGGAIFSVVPRRKNPLKHYRTVIELLFVNRKKYDAVVLNTCHMYYIFPLLCAKIFGIKKRILHSHNSGDELEITFLRKLLIVVNKLIMRFTVSDFWACSKIAGKWMFGNDVNFKIVHNSINCQKFKFNLQSRHDLRKTMNLSNKFVVGHIGRFSFQKNHVFLLDIFSEICKKNNSAILLLVGDIVEDRSYLEAAQKKAHDIGIIEHVKFLGLRNDISDLMQTMDCFVLPSKFEGLPLVGIEAQAAGLPCFFADTITEELGITDLAHFVSLDTAPEKWAEQILQNSNIDRKDMSKEISAAGYDIKTEIKKIEDFYTN